MFPDGDGVKEGGREKGEYEFNLFPAKSLQIWMGIEFVNYLHI